MARKLRIEYAGALYHLVSRGNRNEPIFRDDGDREILLSLLGNVCAKTGWQVYAYCLLPNHLHLVMETPEPNLVAGMKWLLGNYTAGFNRRHKLSGHLFSGRYKSLVVAPENEYLRAIGDYVHLNPRRAALLGPGESLQDFRWSSLPGYSMPAGQRPRWLRVDRLLAACGRGRDTPKGRRAFLERLESPDATVPLAQLRRIRRGWCFGSDQFRRQLLARVGKEMGPYHYGAELREAAEEQAERVVQGELDRLGWTEADLVARRKGDRAKVRIVQRLRAETTVTLNWISGRLRMGTRTYVAHLLYWNKRLAATRKRTSASKRKVPKRESTTPILLTDPILDLTFDPTFD